MNRMTIIAALLAASSTAYGADLITKGGSEPRPAVTAPMPIFAGRASVIDGRSLWYPQFGQKVRLADIDACELPQWALDPNWQNRHAIKAPNPVPCGPIAKAWLKRAIGAKTVECRVVSYADDGIAEAQCTSGRGDLGLEMLRVGWAHTASPFPRKSEYLSYQQSAMAARYGMWATYVLDTNEWRRRAIDKTADRQPIADHNLLAKRESEISPPFQDARNKPKRTDR